MTTSVQRVYKSKDVDMLIAVSTIVQSSITNKAFLQAKRSTWSDPFFEDLQTEIDTIIQNHLGIDNAKDLRQATQVVINIQTNAIKDLAEFKVQLIEDLKQDTNNLNEILMQLGFTTYHKAAQKGDQEALINLLYQFKTNLTAALRTEIVTAGTADTTINTIIGYADTLKNANITQEGTKGNRKEITAQAIIEFNRVYSKVISVAKISAKFFKDNPPIKDQFSFSKVAKTINASRTFIKSNTKIQ